MSIEKTLKKISYLQEKGLISKLGPIPNFTDEPHFFNYSCSYINENLNEEIEGVSIDIDENKAKIRAFGECIERYALQENPKNMIIDSYESLKGNALDPCEFINFNEDFFNGKKEAYFENLRKFPLSWVIGMNALSKEKVLIPAQLVYVPFKRNEPIIRSQISTGTAANENSNSAILGGIFEIIERDSFMLSYYSRDSLKKVELDNDLKELEDYFKRYYLSINVFDMTSDLDVPSFMCINIDKTGVGPAVSVGLSTNFSSRKSILKSILESQQSRQWLRYNYISENKNIRNCNNTKSLLERGYYWYPVESVNRLDFLINNSETTKIRKDLKTNLNDLLKKLDSKRIRIYVVDITPKIIEDAGFKVIKSISPDLHPLYLYEDYPHHYSKRLIKKLNGKKINSFPHPFL